MKLFYFNPNSYGAEYFVMSENEVKAHKALLDKFIEKFNIEKNKGLNLKSIDDFEKCKNWYILNLPENVDDMDFSNKKYIYEKYIEWKDVNPLKKSTYPEKYTIDEYGENKVIGSEIA